MEKDIFAITGEIQGIREFAIKMEQVLMESPNEEDIDFDKIERMADEISDMLNNLVSELEE